MSVFRSQTYQEHCHRCKAPATAQCPQCQIWLCPGHAAEYGCCSPCAGAIQLAVSGAGRGQRGLGAATTLWSAIWLLVLASLHMITSLTAAVVAAFLAGGLALVGWSFLASPRIAQRRFERELDERRLLMAPRAPERD